MGLYAFSIEERNGEREYSYDCIVRAPNITAAESKAKEYAEGFFGGDCEYDPNDDGYYFQGGCIFVKVDDLRPVGKDEWMENAFQAALIH